MEPGAAARAALAAARDAVGRKGFEAVVRRLEAHARNSSPHAAIEDDRAFHIGVAALCANDKFHSSVRDCYANVPAQKGKAPAYNVNGMGPSFLLLCMHRWYRDETRGQHVAIARAILGGQDAAARAAMLEHIEYVEEKFRTMKAEVERAWPAD